MFFIAFKKRSSQIWRTSYFENRILELIARFLISWRKHCSKFPRGRVHQPATVCILQPHLRTRRCVGFWISSHPAFRFPCGYEYPRTFGRNRTFCGWENLSEHEKTGSSLKISISPHVFLLPFVSSFSPSFWRSFSSWNSKRSKWSWNGWCWTTERRLFHSSRVKLPLVKTSASWCLVSLYRIWILESRLILSNNQSKASLWVKNTCLIVRLRPFISIAALSAWELTMGRDVRPTAGDGPPDPEGADPQGQDKRDGSRGGRAMHKLKILATEA